MAPKFKDGDAVVAFSGKWISWAHTVVAYTAFLAALFTGLSLHYHKIVQNEYYVGKIRGPLVTRFLTFRKRATRKNGFHQYPPPLEIAILSAPSFSSSSPLLRVRAYNNIFRRRS